VIASEAMAVIKPISDLRNKSRQLSKICHETGEPIYITKNGADDLVLMSVASYEEMQAQLYLYNALAEAEASERAGDRGISVKEMRRRLRRR
jgi:prevent-host-death family protein